jgi:hypothetical protein
MRDKLLGTFDTNIHIEELRSYYDKVVANYQHLKWSFDIGGNDIIDLWRNRMLAEPSTLLPYGWAIQSNIEDLSKPCPPYNITSHHRIEYRNTELVFGPIDILQKNYSNAYRYSISVLPPNGKVTLPIYFFNNADSASGSFNGKLDLNSPAGAFGGSGQIKPTPPSTNSVAIIYQRSITSNGTVSLGPVESTNVAYTNSGGTIDPIYFKFRGVRLSTSASSAATTN